MASYSEIQKLEQRHRESPDGRTFAPLADAYRRAGRLSEAVELVQAGLLKHPEYVSAHIVLGRCLMDQDDAEGARAAFERVFELDSENIIALRTLSELAERDNRLTDAARWLTLAKDVDPMNADVRDALERIESELGETPPAAATAPPQALGIEGAPPTPVPPADEPALTQTEADAAGGGELEGEEAGSPMLDATPERAEQTGEEPGADLDVDALFEEVAAAQGLADDAARDVDERAAAEVEGEADVEEPTAVDSEPIVPEPQVSTPEPSEPAVTEVDEPFELERAAETEPEMEAPPPVFDLEVVRVEDEDQVERDEDEADEPSPPIEDLEIERTSGESAPQGAEPWMPVGMDQGPIVPFEGGVDFTAVEGEVQELDIEFDEVEATPEEADVSPVEGLADTQFESAFPDLEDAAAATAGGEDAAAAEAVEPQEPAPSDEVSDVPPAEEPATPEIVVEGPEVAASLPEAEEALADASLEELFGDALPEESDVAEARHDSASRQGLEDEAAGEARARADSALADLPVFIPEESAPVPPPPATVGSPVDDDYSAADHETLGEAEPVVTETMAELLVSQGHVDEAIRVYRKLLEAKPGDADLERRLAALQQRSATSAGPTVGEWFQRLAATELAGMTPSAHATAPADGVDDTTGPAPAGESGAGPLSLEEVFGEAGSEEAAPPETGQTGAEAPPDAASTAPPEEPDGFSFEAFFGGETADAESPSEPDEDSESDLDEFQAWLRGLKS